MEQSYLVFDIGNVRLENTKLLDCFPTVKAAITWSTFVALVANNNMKAGSIQNWFVIIILRYFHFTGSTIVVVII